MGRSSADEQKIRKLGKIGGEKNFSYYVTLPIDFVRDMGWRDGQKIVVKKSSKKPRLIIEDWE